MFNAAPQERHESDIGIELAATIDRREPLVVVARNHDQDKPGHHHHRRPRATPGLVALGPTTDVRSWAVRIQALRQSSSPGARTSRP